MGQPVRGSARFALALAALSAIVALAGCSSITQRVVEGATGVKVSPNGKVVAVQDPNLTAADDAKLPEGFPADVPVYSSSTVVNSMSLASDKGTTFTVELQTSDTAASAAAWYDIALRDEGWTITGTVKSADGGALITSEKADRLLSATITRGSGTDAKTIVAIACGPT